MTTLKELLVTRAGTMPDRMAFRFAARAAGGDREMTYAELLGAASALARTWTERYPQGSRAIVSTPPGRDFVLALFACFLGDIVAVPTYPPTRGDSLARFNAILRDCRPDFVVTTADLGPAVNGTDAGPAGCAIEFIDVDAALLSDGGLPVRASGPLALLQYTSGSTGAPKGVMLSHANLLSNSACIARSFGHSETSRGLIWLPPYHDMGLIGGILQPVYSGFPVTLMSPQHFLQQPFHWLKRISDERVTTSGGPNLAYELCVQKVTAEERAQLDLSSWSVCFSGSEPVRAETIERFVEAFGSCGFSRRAFFPCYGLAEATLMVSGSVLGKGPRVLDADQEKLNAGQLAEATADAKVSRRLVSCGSVVTAAEVRIVDPSSCRPLSAGEIGEVWVRGPGVAMGFWEKPEATEATFGAKISGEDAHAYLRTGDLGALYGNELYITGRRKEIVIVGGRKFHPQDIEDSLVSGIDLLAGRKAVVFANEDDTAPGLVALQELPVELRERTDEIGARMRQHIAAHFDVDLVEVLFVRRSSIPTTLTGKTQRLAAAERYRAGSIVAIATWRRHASTATSAPEAIGTETSPRQAIEQLLGRSLITEDFDRTLIDLGFDSLRMAELAALFVRACHRDVPAEFERSPVRDLIAAPRRQDAATPMADAPALNEHPLSDRQKSIWYAEAAGAGDAYMLARVFTVRGALTAETVRDALLTLVERHAILRSRVVETPQAIVQRLAADLSLDFVAYERGNVTADEWIERLRAEARQRFDLHAAAPWRVQLVRLTSRRHLLLFAVHHLVCDYTSLEILHREFWALCAGAGPALTPPPKPFLQFLAQEREAASGWATSSAFWRATLAGCPTPADFPRCPTSGRHVRGAFRQHTVALRPGDFDRLNALCRAEGCTPYVGLVATLQLLLAIYNDRDDVAIGTTHSLRRPTFGGTIGYFVNPVVLRQRIDRGGAFLDTLREAARTTGAVAPHAHLPLAYLVEQLNPDRTSSDAGFFAVLFNYLSSATADDSGTLLTDGTFVRGELTVKTEPVLPATPQFPLVVQVLRSSGGAKVVVDYDDGYYDAATIRGLVANWAQLIASCSASPSAPCRDLKVLSPWEASCLRQFNHQVPGTAAIANVFERFEAARRRYPEKIAVRCPEQALTYREFGARVDRIASALRQRGVERGAIVAIALPRSADFVTAMWATLKAGGAVLAIDPALPWERIAYMLQQLPVRLQVGQVGPAHASEHDIVAFDELLNAAITPVSDWSHRPDDPAYVIFTSGSTGRPKAVANSHGSLANVLGATDLGFTADEVFAQYTSVSFDISIWELLLPPLLGATMVVVPAVDSLDPARLVRAVSTFGITAMQFVPTILRLFLNECSPTTTPRSLRRVVCGGEKLDVRLKDRFFEVLGPSVRLWHLYGPAEAAIFVTQQDVRPEHTTIAIGRPIPNAKLYVLGRELELLPVGAVGEICIGGIAIAKGYLDNAALTAERFRSGGRSLGRIYRTGDLGRWLPCGEIEYAGRVDHQVKVRGIRIELEEIERVLLEAPTVRAAAVLLQADEKGEAALHAYVECAPATSPSELRRFLRQRLVDAMVPQRFLAVARMPQTPGGKIDRQQLASAPAEPLRDAMTAEVPDDPIVRDLRATFAEVLRNPDIDVHEHFFALGGHSLQLVQLAQLIQQRLGVSLQLADVISRPSIVELAALVRERSGTRGAAVETDEVVGVL